MHFHRSVFTAWAAFVAVPLAAQQSDSARRADSLMSAREHERIAHEPRPPADSALPPSLHLTRKEAIAMALANNPTIVIAREQVAQSHARVTQATAFPDPTFGFTVQGFQGPLWPRPAVETDLIFGVTIPFPQKFWLKGQLADGDLGSLEAGYTLQRQLIQAQTSQAYDSLLVSLKHREDLLVARGLSGDFLKKTEARFTAGTVARLDVVKAMVAVAQSENDLIANERGVANARAALNRLLGRVLGADVIADDSLAIVAIPADFDRLARLAMAHRPELFAIQRQMAAADAGESLAQQYFLPDLNVGVTYNNPYGFPSSYTTGVGISVPLLFWQHQSGEVAEAKHRQLELAAAQKDVIAQVEQDLRTAYATATTAYRQAVFIRDQLLPSAQEQYDIAFKTYTLGGSSALEVIDAQHTLLDARDQYATALGALNDAIADLERAVGAPLDSTPPDKKND